MKRQIKKTVIVENDRAEKHPEQPSKRQRSRSRSRDKQRPRNTVVETIDPASRRALLMKMRNRQEEADQVLQPKIQSSYVAPEPPRIIQRQPEKLNEKSDSEDSEAQAQQEENVLLKPVYVSREVRDTVKQREEEQMRRQMQQQRKHKITKQNTKLILNETVRRCQYKMKAEGEEAEQEDLDNDSDHAEMPDDDDTKDTAQQYELWKIRELKRIRRDRQERQKYVLQQAEVQRRRRMTDQERLAENKLLGSDLTDNTQSTKYVFMQKYYHKGAFFQDKDDELFKRDYNMPTPMELQDKSMLPKILQKRKNDFGKKGQSKYQHLTAEDTTDFDPKNRPDEAIRIAMQRKMGGYKGAFLGQK